MLIYESFHMGSTSLRMLHQSSWFSFSSILCFIIYIFLVSLFFICFHLLETDVDRGGRGRRRRSKKGRKKEVERCGERIGKRDRHRESFICLFIAYMPGASWKLHPSSHVGDRGLSTAWGILKAPPSPPTWVTGVWTLPGTSWKLHPQLPRGWQGCKHCNHPLLSLRVR